MNGTCFVHALSANTMTAKTKIPSGIIPLFKSKMGQYLRIHTLPQGKLRSFFLRLGIREGEYIECYERLPGGTVVIKKNRQEIAIGHELAREILVVIEE